MPKLRSGSFYRERNIVAFKCTGTVNKIKSLKSVSEYLRHIHNTSDSPILFRFDFGTRREVPRKFDENSFPRVKRKLVYVIQFTASTNMTKQWSQLQYLFIVFRPKILVKLWI